MEGAPESAPPAPVLPLYGVRPPAVCPLGASIPQGCAVPREVPAGGRAAVQPEGGACLSLPACRAPFGCPPNGRVLAQPVRSEGPPLWGVLLYGGNGVFVGWRGVMRPDHRQAEGDMNSPARGPQGRRGFLLHVDLPSPAPTPRMPLVERCDDRCAGVRGLAARPVRQMLARCLWRSVAAWPLRPATAAEGGEDRWQRAVRPLLWCGRPRLTQGRRTVPDRSARFPLAPLDADALVCPLVFMDGGLRPAGSSSAELGESRGMYAPNAMSRGSFQRCRRGFRLPLHVRAGVCASRGALDEPSRHLSPHRLGDVHRRDAGATSTTKEQR